MISATLKKLIGKGNPNQSATVWIVEQWGADGYPVRTWQLASSRAAHNVAREWEREADESGCLIESCYMVTVRSEDVPCDLLAALCGIDCEVIPA